MPLTIRGKFQREDDELCLGLIESEMPHGYPVENTQMAINVVELKLRRNEFVGGVSKNHLCKDDN